MRRSFSQRYGYEPLPEPMKLEELSTNLRQEIWIEVREFLLEKRESVGEYYYFKDPGKRFFERVLGRYTKQPGDAISTEYDQVLSNLKNSILSGQFNQVLDLIEIMVNDKDLTDAFVIDMRNLFEQSGAAYGLDTSQRPYCFVPRASKEQGEATQQAIETIRESNLDAAAAHLRQATEHINAQQYADSIADSIHAVESVARMIDPEANKTLGPALNSLAKAGLLKHESLKAAFKKLYGYTSNEQGIRHALLDQDSPNVGLDEAMFMFGACASFAAYLAQKHRQAEGSKAR